MFFYDSKMYIMYINNNLIFQCFNDSMYIEIVFYISELILTFSGKMLDGKFILNDKHVMLI